MNTVNQLKTIKNKTASKVGAELSRTGGLLRLAPAWVPRSFLQPGLRIKLHPDDTYAYGLNRGGIDERWFASTTPTANIGRAWDEGLIMSLSARNASRSRRPFRTPGRRSPAGPSGSQQQKRGGPRFGEGIPRESDNARSISRITATTTSDSLIARTANAATITAESPTFAAGTQDPESGD